MSRVESWAINDKVRDGFRGGLGAQDTVGGGCGVEFRAEVLEAVAAREEFNL